MDMVNLMKQVRNFCLQIRTQYVTLGLKKEDIYKQTWQHPN